MTFGIDLACGFRVLEERGELSINAIPQTPVICVVAYFQAADWIDSLVS